MDRRVERFQVDVSAEQRCSRRYQAVRRICNEPARERAREWLFELVIHNCRVASDRTDIKARYTWASGISTRSPRWIRYGGCASRADPLPTPGESPNGQPAASATVPAADW